jgi:phosphoglycerol transferase MdoB-like AlkP superfamily enzyme
MPATDGSIVKKISISFCLLLATFLLIRGGWQLSPINQSMSYYSDKPIENHAAVNTFWNLFRDILNNRGGRTNPYTYLPETQANQLVDSLYFESEILSPEILKTSKPNVVFIILESFTADVVESLGGEKNVSPQLEKLIKEGILLENTFASGDRTDKGLVAILSGFPSQATQSIIKENGKQEKLPAISQVFKNAGYSTSFYYGGESEFAGMKSYVMSHAYDKLIDKHEFASDDMNSKWGAYDGKVFEKQLKDLNQQKQPFFSTLLSLTNHEPFELPVKPKFPGEDLKNRFKSTAFYTDSCLGAFIQSAAKQAWYKNTLFVVVADHGHRLPKDEFENWHPRRYRIPLIMFGDVLKPGFRGKKISKFGGQTDIAKTVLNQLKMDSSPFKWSKDLLNPHSADFAFFDWDNGFGWATPTQILTFDNVSKQVIYRENKTEQDTELENRGKAYLQKVYQTYLDY